MVNGITMAGIEDRMTGNVLTATKLGIFLGIALNQGRNARHGHALIVGLRIILQECALKEEMVDEEAVAVTTDPALTVVDLGIFREIVASLSKNAVVAAVVAAAVREVGSLASLKTFQKRQRKIC